MAMGAVVLYIAAFFQPMWGFYLYAPQYPHGLTLSVFLNRVGGDVMEINILNHYIGMAKLDEAAKLERQLSAYGLAGIALALLLMVFVPGRKYARWFAIPAFLFPVVFLGFFYYWMWTFGHTLSPAAPVTVSPFTPTLLGQGQIGNFRTVGLPGPGFYMVLVSAFLAAASVGMRRSICAACPARHECQVVCDVSPAAVVGETIKRLSDKS
jgi:copper chaperone NosL